MKRILFVAVFLSACTSAVMAAASERNDRNSEFTASVSSSETSFGKAVNDPTDVSSSRGIRRNDGEYVASRGSQIEVRTYQGYNNNLADPEMGSVDAALERWTTIVYADAIEQPYTEGRPSARLVSNAVFDQPYSRPNDVNASDYLWQWGQFLDHDIDLTDGANPPEPMPIDVPLGDPYFDPDGTGIAQIPFNRSIYSHQSGHDAANPRLQINEISAWIDASNVYGSDVERASALRTFDGAGTLATSEGGFLPFNTQGLPNSGGSGDHLFLAGDVRANEQVGLTAMHTLFVREHNRLAEQIALDNPAMNGEEIYQKARRLVGGIVQFITYNEFLPVLLGPDALTQYQGYDSTVDAGISNVFSTAAYRFGHSALSPTLKRIVQDGSVHPNGHLELRDAFFSPHQIAETDNFEAILRGLASQVCQRIDANVIDDVRNFLFGAPGAGGLDLVALNVQRGRDHGLGLYSDIRQEMGLAPVTEFTQISSDVNIQQRLAKAYSSAAEVDVWVGGLSEDRVAGAMVGELFYKIIKKQFTVLRDGDRFWYQNYLSADEIALVETSTLAAVIRRNSSIDQELADDVFVVSNLADVDIDGVADIRDNCIAVENPDQTDSDNDGFGNACDADLNNDGHANFMDLSIFAGHFFSTSEVSDFNADGVVNNLDLAIFRSLFLQPVGPSGLHQ